MESLDDEREGALQRQGAETTRHDGVSTAGAVGGQHRQPPPRGRPPCHPSSPPLTYGPGEAEGEADGVAEGGVGAARPVGDAEGVGAEHGGDGAAVGAGRLGGHAGLVVLEADAEEGLAVALLQPGAAGAAPPAAVAVAEEPLLVDELLQLQLEHPGAGHLAGTGTGTGTVSPRSGPVPRRLPPARCPPIPATAATPEGASVPPAPLTYLAAAGQHREEGERQQEPASHGGGAALVPSRSSPLSCLRGGKGKVSLGGNQKKSNNHEAAKAARPSGAGRVIVTVSFFQERL